MSDHRNSISRRQFLGGSAAAVSGLGSVRYVASHWADYMSVPTA